MKSLWADAAGPGSAFSKHIGLSSLDSEYPCMGILEGQILGIDRVDTGFSTVFGVNAAVPR